MDISSSISPLAGTLAAADTWVNVPALVTAFYARRPDWSVPAQRVAFGTSGHRGSALSNTFNECHVLAITQAICDCRAERGITGPLYLGMDTHALSVPAHAAALEVLAANGVVAMIAERSEYTPTPAISRAILAYNRGRSGALADGIVLTPSHNPPEDGGFKYNPPNGGPADATTTAAIESRANRYLRDELRGVRRIAYERALRADTTHKHDFLNRYVDELADVVDMSMIREKGIAIGVDPLGGAGVHYWRAIAERYRLSLTVLSQVVDPTFHLVPLDWDGRIRMDPSSRYAMRNLLSERDRFDLVVAFDTDHDRHGIICGWDGLLAPNHYLAAAIDYLFQNRPQWAKSAAIGKTIVSSHMIDRVVARWHRTLYEVPVGFKWFVDGLLDGSLAFAGEESAGATVARMDGHVWTTDKDGIVLGLLAAEMTARTGRDPGEAYQLLTQVLGNPVYARIDISATAAQKDVLLRLSPDHVKSSSLAGERIKSILTRAPGNGAAIGGLKVIAENGWFAARPSGTEDVFKIYAESFLGDAHLHCIQQEAQIIVTAALASAGLQ